MMRWIRIVCILIQKEFRLEWRGREMIALLVCNALFMAILVGAGASSAMLDATTTKKIYPTLLWVVFILSTLSSVTRSYEQELEGRAFEGLLLNSVTGPQMYLSKAVVSSLLFFINFCLLMFVLSVALNVSLVGVVKLMLFVGFGASTALAGLIVLLGAVASTSKLRGVLMPLLALPLLFPLFFAGVELTTELVLRGAIEPASVWGSLLVVINAVYLVLGVNLFEVAVRD